ncbi:MAG: hypothetical protein LKF31_10155 [Muribaculaceae bacterium]|jgi:hypothetical protein|nr:hypothetical protein [Muribaculaceae bacterium]
MKDYQMKYDYYLLDRLISEQFDGDAKKAGAFLYDAVGDYLHAHVNAGENPCSIPMAYVSDFARCIYNADPIKND